MSLQRLILIPVAAITIALSGALGAQTAVDPSAAAAVQEGAYRPVDAAHQEVPGSAAQYKHMKVDEATAADAKYHANRTEPNRLARDKAESDAAAAIDRANGPTGYRQR